MKQAIAQLPYSCVPRVAIDWILDCSNKAHLTRNLGQAAQGCTSSTRNYKFVTATQRAAREGHAATVMRPLASPGPGVAEAGARGLGCGTAEGASCSCRRLTCSRRPPPRWWRAVDWRRRWGTAAEASDRLEGKPRAHAEFPASHLHLLQCTRTRICMEWMDVESRTSSYLKLGGYWTWTSRIWLLWV